MPLSIYFLQTVFDAQVIDSSMEHACKPAFPSYEPAIAKQNTLWTYHVTHTETRECNLNNFRNKKISNTFSEKYWELCEEHPLPRIHVGHVNSSPPSPAYMRQETGSALVQVMACRLTAPSHYLKQSWLIVNWTLRNKFQWYFNRHSIISIEENAFENVVCDFPGKLSRGRWVNVDLWYQGTINSLVMQLWY